MRSKISKVNQYFISRYRYNELKNWCLQYGEWKEKIDAINWYSFSSTPIKIASESDNSSPVENYVEKVEKYHNYIHILNRVAELTDSVIGPYILYGVTLGIPYDIVRLKYNVPVCREKYYELYRKFFWLLDKERD